LKRLASRNAIVGFQQEGVEMDFPAQKSGKTLYVQVACLLSHQQGIWKSFKAER
jgi:hypothetical protein